MGEAARCSRPPGGCCNICSRARPCPRNPPSAHEQALQGNRGAERQLVGRLQSELDTARQEVDSLQREAQASAALRDELAHKWVFGVLFFSNLKVGFLSRRGVAAFFDRGFFLNWRAAQ